MLRTAGQLVTLGKCGPVNRTLMIAANPQTAKVIFDVPAVSNGNILPRPAE
jgi:hypothetical protein